MTIQWKSRKNGGFRWPWLARASGGRWGMGTWTQTELDAIHARAKARVAEFRAGMDESERMLADYLDRIMDSGPDEVLRQRVMDYVNQKERERGNNSD